LDDVENSRPERMFVADTDCALYHKTVQL